jgi:hypothetical protein
MLRATCPKMIVIARLMHEKCDLHFALTARNAPDIEIRQVEVEVFRVNRLMTNHRRNCPHCRRNVTMPIRKTRPCSNGPVDEESGCLALVYSPEEAFWNKTFKMRDVELVK